MARAVNECDQPDDCRASRPCYAAGCRGSACSEANARYVRERRRELNRPDAVPVMRRVPTGQVRTHLEELRAAGVGWKRVAAVAGLSERTVWLIASGRQPSVTPATKDRLLAVMPSMLAPNALVDAGETLERLHELAEVGWGDEELARVLLPSLRPGDATWQLARLRSRALITRRVEDAVRRLHEDEIESESESTGDPLAEWQLFAEPAEWREEAECLRLDGDDRTRNLHFFPTRGESATPARAVCERCPVAEPCLDFALQTAAQGVWGATTGGERRLIRRLGWTAGETFAAAAEDLDRPLIGLLEDALERLARAS